MCRCGGDVLLRSTKASRAGGAPAAKTSTSLQQQYTKPLHSPFVSGVVLQPFCTRLIGFIIMYFLSDIDAQQQIFITRYRSYNSIRKQLRCYPSTLYSVECGIGFIIVLMHTSAISSLGSLALFSWGHTSVPT